MSKELFVKAEEVARELGISKPYAYKLVREMNEELKQKGFITIPGRVSRRYFEEKFYGLRDEQLNGRIRAPMISTCLYWTIRRNSGQRRSPSWRQSRRRKKARWRARSGG